MPCADADLSLTTLCFKEPISEAINIVIKVLRRLCLFLIVLQQHQRTPHHMAKMRLLGLNPVFSWITCISDDNNQGKPSFQPLFFLG